MRGHEKKFIEYLKEQGMTMTRERKIILDEVFNIHKHFEADDLLVTFHQRGERVSRATIFRTLGLLVDSRLLCKVFVAHNRIFYEHVFGHEHHDHMVCMKCDRIIEFHNPQMEDIQDGICKSFDFKLIRHSHTLYGHCKKCT